MQKEVVCTFFNQPIFRVITLLLALSALSACSSAAHKPVSYHGKTKSKSSLLVKAKSMIGKPYRYGGNHPSTGFDCSGFVQYSHAAIGIKLPRTAALQKKATHRINKQQLRPGDLVFFRISRKRYVSHVGIYLGGGKFIHSPSSGKHVSIASLDNPYWKRTYSSAGRVF